MFVRSSTLAKAFSLRSSSASASAIASASSRDAAALAEALAPAASEIAEAGGVSALISWLEDQVSLAEEKR